MVACLPNPHRRLADARPRSVRKLLWRLVFLIGLGACAFGTVRSMRAPQGFGPALAFLGFFAALDAAYVLRPEGRYGVQPTKDGGEPR